jgi:glycosyltransferase involved in cell wall biosynthesis
MTGPAGRGRLLTTHLHQRRKLRVVHPVEWTHHRGGWTDVTNVLIRDLGCSDGMPTVNSVEETLVSGRVLDTPWVGFSHEVPHHDYAVPDLARLQEFDTWKASIRHCRGLWVLSSHNKQYLDACNLPFPVSFIHYPVAAPNETFSYAAFCESDPPQLLHIGVYLRRLQPFFDLRAPGYRKVLLECTDFGRHKALAPGPQPVTVLHRVCDEEYDRLLARSVVFLNLIDAGANTTVVECIVRGTPVLINRVGGVSEYLGEDYPLYYTSLEEAAAKLANADLIARTTRYLKTSIVQPKLTFERFIRDLQTTAVYRAIPVPASQQSISSGSTGP